MLKTINLTKHIFNPVPSLLIDKRNVEMFLPSLIGKIKNAPFSGFDIETHNGNAHEGIKKFNNTGKNVLDQTLKPTTIDQYEIGAKKNLFNNALAINLSLYQIIYQNYYQTAEFLADGVTQNSDSTIKEFAGKMRSRGVELDITGNPTENISIIAGISYNNSEYTDTPDNTGYVENQRLVRTPATTANAANAAPGA